MCLYLHQHHNNDCRHGLGFLRTSPAPSMFTFGPSGMLLTAPETDDAASFDVLSVWTSVGLFLTKPAPRTFTFAGCSSMAFVSPPWPSADGALFLFTKPDRLLTATDALFSWWTGSSRLPITSTPQFAPAPTSMVHLCVLPTALSRVEKSRRSRNSMERL